MGARYTRYVAIGDSSTEGLDDPDGAGSWRGWADRLATQVAQTNPGLQYANLAVRGRLVAEIREQQLPRALELQPDLVTAFAGVNDLLRRRLDLGAVLAQLEEMFTALTATGATVATITCPDASRVMPLARPVRARIAAYNDGVREVARRTGVLLADIAAVETAVDPRLWSEDRLHTNALGHTRIAQALAEALHLPGATGDWRLPLPAQPHRPRHEVLRGEAAWLRRHLGPWLLRRLRGQSSGDGVVAKRPGYGPVG
ncbi:MAG TPA: SGNH/GDSL hydrolase family protein [Kineosporiaceae bacterium]|nr:SGNH/GDSL hydrolase family protein [Kineosporiaceae bacterium]